MQFRIAAAMIRAFRIGDVDDSEQMLMVA